MPNQSREKRLEAALKSYVEEPHCSSYDKQNNGSHSYYDGGPCDRCFEQFLQSMEALKEESEIKPE